MMLLLFVAGLGLLIAGAEALVKGASRIAAILGISPLVIGLTVVAFGTSSPELAVSFKAALADQARIAVGNVVGSNIFNVLFILGISALIVPLVVSQQLVRFDVPLMIAVSVLTLVLALDGSIGRLDGTILVLGLLGYLGFLIRISRMEAPEIHAEYAREFGPGKRRAGRRHLIDVSLVAGGLGLLVLGSHWLVQGAVEIARHLGLSELIIGLTLVAAGTSLPEVVASIVASLRGERDIAVGNVVGSNLFNLTAVLGLSGLVAPSGIEISDGVLRFDLPVMIAVAVACLPIFFTGHRIERWEGALFLGYYAAYTTYLVLGAMDHDTLPMFRAAMFYFVLPLTILTLILVTARALSQGVSPKH